MGKVIIKCFKTIGGFYFYDRYTNSVVRVNQSEYDALKQIETGNAQILKSPLLQKFLENGLLQESKVSKIEHPEHNYLKYWANEKASQLILQITQQCNLRCSYCTYSGNYYNRVHSSERMSFDIAKQALEFYFQRSVNLDHLTIGFYGGEPLLEFDLIKKCVDFCKAKIKGKRIEYHITTNGVLLTDDIIAFLKDNEFNVMISLDGDEQAHDINRKTRTGEGTFKKIISNVKKIKRNYPEFYANKVTFNTVLNPKVDLVGVVQFFSNRDLFFPGQVTLNVVADARLKDETLAKCEENFWLPRTYEYLKILLYLIGDLEKKDTNILFSMLEKELKRMHTSLHKHTEESEIMSHGGPCIPGSRRLFVTTKGELYPCERVNEVSSRMNIGSLDKGFNYHNMEYLLNGADIMKEMCHNCWNLRQCKICTGTIDAEGEELKKVIKKQCSRAKVETIFFLEMLCTLTEFGYRYNAEDKNEESSYLPI